MVVSRTPFYPKSGMSVRPILFEWLRSVKEMSCAGGITARQDG